VLARRANAKKHAANQVKVAVRSTRRQIDAQVALAMNRMFDAVNSRSTNHGRRSL
jgi:hypothetical protein